MNVHSFVRITLALEMTNGGRTEWVNCFSYFADKGIRAYDGSVGVRKHWICKN